MSVSAVSRSINPLGVGSVPSTPPMGDPGSSFAKAVANDSLRVDASVGTTDVANEHVTVKVVDTKVRTVGAPGLNFSDIQAQIDYASGKSIASGSCASAFSGNSLPLAKPQNSSPSFSSFSICGDFDPLAVVKMGMVSEDNSFVRAIELMLGIVPGSITNPSKVNEVTTPQDTPSALPAIDQAGGVNLDPAQKDAGTDPTSESATKLGIKLPGQTTAMGASQAPLPNNAGLIPRVLATQSIAQGVDKTITDVLMKMGVDNAQV